MAKTATPKKRQWQNLTDIRKLRHIENTLDKAITAIQEEGGVESLEDFKNFVEEFSEHSGKAPITVELCTETGSEEIKGFRFYLTKDPNQKTSGKYLIKNLGDVTSKDEDYFTPNNVMNLLGIETEELENLDLDEEDENFDLDNDLENLEEDLLDDEKETTPHRATNRQSHNRPKQKSTSKTAKLKATAEAAEEDDIDLEELLEDDEVSFAKPKYQSRRTVHITPQAQRRNWETERNLTDNLAEEGSRLSANAAIKGSELNGINEVGLAGQLTSLGIMLGTKGIAAFDELLEQIKQQREEKRLSDILQDLEEKDVRVGKLFKRIQKVVENTPAEELPEELVPFAETFKATPSQSELLADNPVASIAAQVGEKIDKLGSQLDPEYESQPLQLDKNAPINEQLDQIEKYLNRLSKRLDRLEGIVSDLEERLSKQVQTESVSEATGQSLHSPAEASVGENIVPTTQLEVEQVASPPSTELKGLRQKPTVVNHSTDALEDDFDEEELLSIEKTSDPKESLEAEEPEDVLEQIVVQQKVQQQQVACAESLVNFAMVTAQVTQQSIQEGIPLTGGCTLFIKGQDDQLSCTLQNTDRKELFTGIKQDGRWNVHSDSLTPEEKKHILNLPQSVEEYVTKASAQALVEKFQDTFPKRFSGEKEPIFTWKDENKQPKYEFEIIFPPDGTKILQGFDPRQGDAQVFEAVLVRGQPPDIKNCRIPIAEMESLLSEPQATKSPPSKNSRDVTKREIQQQKDELQV